MTYNTINDAQTIAGDAGGMILAGRYRIVRQLGQGGMGSVWLAEDTQLDNKPFAIKMLPTILVSNKRAYRQLKDEALVAMKLTHPNIVTLRAFEENNGNPFLVMDYIDGETLDDYLAEHSSRVERVGRVEKGDGSGMRPACPLGGIPEADVIRILKPIAAALDYAHGEGVVHRDVKPANVMIRKDGHPFILDFGIAREIQETLTRVTGKLSSGTLLYMSPEQLNGEMPKAPQDVYSFAAMAYECLKGEPPFVRGQIEYQIINAQPEPLLGMAIAASVMAGLAKKPGDRPKNCSAVLETRKTKPVYTNGGSRMSGTSSSSVRRPMASRIPIEAKRETGVLNWGTVGVLAAFVLVAVVVGGKLYNDNPSKSPERPAIENTHIDSPAPSMPSVRPPAPQLPPVAPPAHPSGPTKADVDGIYVEAKVQIRKVEDIQYKGDGFDQLKSNCAELFDRAEAYYDLKRWADAAVQFTNVVEECSRVVALDKERRETSALLIEVKDAAIAAKKANADNYCQALYQTATNQVGSGGAAAGRREYGEAKRLYGMALEKFRQCIRVSLEERQKAEKWELQTPAERQRRAKWRKTGEQFTINEPYGLNLTMKWCPAGTFMMGSPLTEEGRRGDEVQHQVTLTKGFWMGETEVTQGQWKKMMSGETILDLARKSLQDNNLYRLGGKQQRLRDWYGGKKEYDDPQGVCGDQNNDVPVYHVKWHEAVEFCRRLTQMERAAERIPDNYEYRLPTEAEWEYACRAGTTTALPSGRDIRILGEKNAPELDDIAWYGGNSSVGFEGIGWDTSNWKEKQYDDKKRAAPREVKRKLSNRWGLYDMIGNVWEWCGDWYGGYGYDSQTDPTGSAEGAFRVIRGGSWMYNASSCRSASRIRISPGICPHDLGFRVALAPLLSGQTQHTAQDEKGEKPKVYLTATLNGMQKSALITEGMAENNKYRTPMTIDVNIPLGLTGKFAVEYFENGVKYIGESRYTSKNGLQNIEITLAKEPEKRFPRPATINFCRHCQYSLENFATIGRNCPVCGKNLWGN